MHGLHDIYQSVSIVAFVEFVFNFFGSYWYFFGVGYFKKRLEHVVFFPRLSQFGHHQIKNICRTTMERDTSV